MMFPALCFFLFSVGAVSDRDKKSPTDRSR